MRGPFTHIITLITLIGLTSCGSEEAQHEAIDEGGELAPDLPVTAPPTLELVDSCTTDPGPNCCPLAGNGLCEEPLGCSLGTDGDDCRGALPTTNCQEATLIEAGGDLTSVVVPFTWSGQVEGVSFTLDPIMISLADSLDSVSISVEDEALDTGLTWTLNDQPLRTVNEASAATGVLPYHYASEPEAGCIAVWPLVEGERLDVEAQLLIAARGSLDDSGVTLSLDVNVIVVGETDITEAELESIFSIANELYALNEGPQIRIAEIFQAEGDSLIPSEGDEVNDLRQRAFGSDLRALNVYVIDDFTEGDGTLGIAGGVPGPNGVALTAASGLIVALEPHFTEDEEGDFALDEQLIGSTIAHELGHQLGLDHTTESDGSTRSAITDLESCAYESLGLSDPSECPDGRNLMFWSSGDESQSQLSPEQVFVLNHNPIVY